MTQSASKHSRHLSEGQAPSRRPSIGHSVLVILWVLLVGLSVFLFRLVDWVFLNWGNLRMNELVYTMTADLSGTNPETYRSAILHTVPLTCLAVALALVISFALRSSKRALSVFRRITALLASLVIVGSAVYFFHTVGLVEYIKNQTSDSSFIEDHYANPDEVDISFPEKRRNLILLFVESMETSYADVEHGGSKPANIIPELTELGLENETFSGDSAKLNGGYALYGATYTMGGIFAQTTGLPLNITSETISVTEGFVPGISALGDVLQNAGYHNYFLLGTDAAFGDRDKYFVDHGDFTIWDFNYSKNIGEIPADYERDWWGYDDAILYENAKQHLLELAASDEPFNLTMLTVDTHAEDGYLCDLCRDDFGDRYSDSFACASRQAYEFVRWCQGQDFYENTTIVVVGDHCTMDHDFADDMPPDADRLVYAAYVNADAVRQGADTRRYCTMDAFPTIIASLGATIEGDRLGLGTNLFSSTPTLVEEMGADVLDEEIAKRSTFIERALGDTENRAVELAFNDTTGCLDVTVADDISSTWSYDYLFGHITNTSSQQEVEFTLSEREGRNATSVPMRLFGYEPGTYEVQIYLMMTDGLPKWYGTQTIELSKKDLRSSSVDETDDVIDASVVSSTGEGSFAARVVESGEQAVLEIRYMCPAGASYSRYWFPTWYGRDAQDDVVWYDGVIQEDGSVIANVDLVNHGTWGFVETDVYAEIEGEQVNLGKCIVSLT